MKAMQAHADDEQVKELVVGVQRLLMGEDLCVAAASRGAFLFLLPQPPPH
jgi:hypothetical protein